ncbi:hypothetical protein IMSAGC004_00683 [Bacteroidaceae bacterium]|nr:hypothetical protein IMSAGC004_00683 [Bacteroidaceae bacterium]
MYDMSKLDTYNITQLSTLFSALVKVYVLNRVFILSLNGNY